MSCTMCGIKTDSGWDGKPLDLCSECKTLDDKNKIKDEEIAARLKLEKQQLRDVEQQNTFKFRTVIFLALGLFIPVWPFTLPVGVKQVVAFS